MGTVDYALFATPQNQTIVEKVTEGFKEGGTQQLATDQSSGRGVINLSRLQDQMFAFMVTNQGTCFHKKAFRFTNSLAY